MAKKKKAPEASWLIIALRAVFELLVQEHDGQLPCPQVVKARWKAVNDAWQALGDASTSIYRATATTWSNETGRCHLTGAPGPCECAT